MPRAADLDAVRVERIARPRTRYTADTKPRNARAIKVRAQRAARAIERDRAARYGTV